MKHFHKILLSAAFALGSNAAVAADKPFEKEIEARTSFMTVVGFNMGILGGMAKGKVPYDSAQAEAAAENIYSASKMSNAAMWPKGSDNSNPELKGITEALPYVWENYKDVAEKHAAWVAASKVLAESAGTGLAGLRKAIGPVGKSCKGCHKVAKAD